MSSSSGPSVPHLQALRFCIVVLVSPVPVSVVFRVFYFDFFKSHYFKSTVHWLTFKKSARAKKSHAVSARAKKSRAWDLENFLKCFNSQ